jgi:hypothetical protein
MQALEKIKAAEIVQIDHRRKGKFYAKFDKDVDMTTSPDDFVAALIVEGRAKFISMENRLMDAGATGTVIEMRKSLFSAYKVDEKVIS